MKVSPCMYKRFAEYSVEEVLYLIRSAFTALFCVPFLFCTALHRTA